MSNEQTTTEVTTESIPESVSAAVQPANEEVAVTSPEATSDTQHLLDNFEQTIKKRLGQAQKGFARERSGLEGKVAALEQQIHSMSQASAPHPTNPYVNQEMQQAVTAALEQQKQAFEEERQRQMAYALQADIMKRERDFTENLSNNGIKKFDDFYESVIEDKDVPITAAIKEAARVVPNPEEILYRLVKNRSELDRISKMHPLDQQTEIVRMAIEMGNSTKQTTNAPKPLDVPKGNPNLQKSSNKNVNTMTVDQLRVLLRDGKL